MAKLVRHLTSNEEIVSSNLAEGNIFSMIYLLVLVSFLRVLPTLIVWCSIVYRSI